MKAKETSHTGMIIGAIGLFIVFTITLIKFIVVKDFTLTVETSIALILLGMSPSIPFTPVYFSIFMDKLIELKKGNTNTVE